MEDCDKWNYILGDIKSVSGKHSEPFSSKCCSVACSIYEADDYKIRKILQVLIAFSMAVSLGLCAKSIKWKYVRIPKRITESKKHEWTRVWGKLHNKDHSVLHLVF
jgi:hypothetical protein